MKTIILFEFEEAYASKIMNIHDKYKKVRYSGESFKINERTRHLFDSLVEKVFNHPDELSIAFVSNRTIANEVFKDVTSLKDVSLPVIKIDSEAVKDETLSRLSENVDKIVWVGPNARIDQMYPCKIAEIMTINEMTHESWLALTESLKN